MLGGFTAQEQLAGTCYMLFQLVNLLIILCACPASLCICCPSLKTLRFCQLVMIIVCLPSLAARSSFSVRNSEEKGEEATQSSVSR